MVKFNPFSFFNLPDDFVGSFLASQFTALPYPRHSFEGQTIVITGANVGLGLEAARHFCRLNAKKIILGCRSTEKGETAKKDIEATTKRTGVIEVWHVDLAAYDSVKEFCARVNKLDRLDAIVENAGIATGKYLEVEGMESTITVNVISTFLMALLVLPKLRETSLKFNILPRLTIVASDAHNQAVFRERSETSIFQAFNNPTYQSDRYNTSKLLEIFVVRELARDMRKSSPLVTLNTLTPGFCHSELTRNAVFPLSLVIWIGKTLLARTTEVGSRTLVAAAAAEDDTHGQYMVDCKSIEPSKFVRSEDGQKAQKKVYAELLEILEGIEPGVTKNIPV